MAAFPETTGEGVGAGLEPKVLLIRFLGCDETLLDFSVQRFSVFFAPLVLAGLLESVFNRRVLKSQNRGYPARIVVDPGAGTGVDVAASSLPAS